MKINCIANTFANYGFEGAKNRGARRRALISQEEADTLVYGDRFLRDHEALLQNIKNNHKRISKETLFRAVENAISRLKYPGSYPSFDADEKLILLLSHVRTEQPKDFKEVLEHLVYSIEGQH